ncbi:NF038129 family PEP-CTERM protein [Luteolibacter yonseiensis]|uniref:NF038129 family PEP-CTERM protein n=1 Tax=Luteolibacter yonseiensis TaxID=1144680 RepID=A0A934R310_9BACT|nr:NF038129 family PEP-CTERM protein [Luteolibacter yonseiensis]MBK1815892.1 NF038129 family PEP-CTERM protein [Luteolibacter yonseiensis]
MKTTLLKNTFLLAAAGLILSSAAQAAVYHVSINTSTLSTTGNGPFYLDFQLNGGDTPSNNSATISNFNFGGGSAVDGTQTTIGSASGNIGSTLTLTNTSAFTEFFQEFVPGSFLKFDLTVTQNLDSITPDLFAFSILDKDLFAIDTTDDFDSLITFNFDTAGPLNVTTSQGQGVYSGVTLAIPEPSTGLLGLLVGGLMIVRRRRA